MIEHLIPPPVKSPIPHALALSIALVTLSCLLICCKTPPSDNNKHQVTPEQQQVIDKLNKSYTK